VGVARRLQRGRRGPRLGSAPLIPTDGRRQAPLRWRRAAHTSATAARLRSAAGPVEIAAALVEEIGRETAYLPVRADGAARLADLL
jgi:hypothetical protein